MIKAIYLSTDGAAETKMFLDSADEFTKGAFDISVIYTATDEAFLEGYNKLKQEKSNVGFFCYTGDTLKEYIMEILKAHKDENIAFFTDGDVFYRNVFEKNINKALSDENVFCFSLRLGNNVTFCYNTKTGNKTFDIQDIDDGMIKWNWSKHYLDFGYPLSVHGHVFRGKDIFKLVKKVTFDSAYGLEDALQMFEYFPREFMVSYEQSAMTALLIGEKMLKMILNIKYRKGESINRNKIEFEKVNSCFMTHKFHFEKEKI